jgi:protocatechuate 3,4-dioxygenase beta subunit
MRSIPLRARARFLGAAAILLVFVGLLLWSPRAASPATERSPSDVAARESIPRAFERVCTQASLSGTVRSTDGRAIGGAKVCAACTGCSSEQLPPAACTVTDEGGRYGLSTSGLRAVVINAVADGYELGFAHGGQPLLTRAEPQAGLDIVLAPGGARVSGTVLDALGGPIANARVVFEKSDTTLRSVLETRSDEEGRFSFPTARGFVTVRAEHEGYAPESKGTTAPVEGLTLQLTPASTVRGRVVARGTGSPIAGVEVRGLPSGMPAKTAPAITDADGAFTLTGLEPGRYAFTATHESWRGATEQLVEVKLAASVSGVVIEVDPAVRVLGRVVRVSSAERAACPRGVVSLDPMQPDPATGSSFQGGPARTNVAPIGADGMVRFAGVLSGRYEVSLQCAEHVLATGPKVLDVAEEDMEVEWTVRPGLSLSVRVVDAFDRAVPNTPLLVSSIRDERPDVEVGSTLVADASGLASVKGELTPGKYTVRPADSNEGESASIVLTDDSPPAELTLKLAGSGSIVVVARSEDGTFVNNLFVSLTGDESLDVALPTPPPGVDAPPAMPLQRQAIEQGGGRYRLDGLKPGNYELRIEDGVNPSLAAPGGTVRITSGASFEYEVVLPRQGSIRGIVVDPHGAPEANAWVSASPADEELSVWARHVTVRQPTRVLSDADGRFELTGLTPRARYTLRVQQPYDNATVVHGVAEGQDVRVVLPTSGSISGVVRDMDGRPVAHAHVSAQQHETASARTTTSGEDGSFELERVPAGKVVLLAGHPALGRIALPLEIAPGQALTGQSLVFPPSPSGHTAPSGLVAPGSLPPPPG